MRKLSILIRNCWIALIPITKGIELEFQLRDTEGNPGNVPEWIRKTGANGRIRLGCWGYVSEEAVLSQGEINYRPFRTVIGWMIITIGIWWYLCKIIPSGYKLLFQDEWPWPGKDPSERHDVDRLREADKAGKEITGDEGLLITILSGLRCSLQWQLRIPGVTTFFCEEARWLSDHLLQKMNDDLRKRWEDIWWYSRLYSPDPLRDGSYGTVDEMQRRLLRSADLLDRNRRLSLWDIDNDSNVTGFFRMHLRGSPKKGDKPYTLEIRMHGTCTPSGVLWNYVTFLVPVLIKLQLFRLSLALKEG